MLGRNLNHSDKNWIVFSEQPNIYNEGKSQYYRTMHSSQQLNVESKHMPKNLTLFLV